MASTTTQTSIINDALQLLGYQEVGSINDNDRGAKAMRRAYDSALLNLLRSNFWSFSITRAELSASATTPAFGKANYFPLPPDFIMIAPPDQTSGYVFGAIAVGYPGYPNTSSFFNDWAIELMPDGQQAIVTDQGAPLYLRYVSSNVTPSMFDPSFAEAFSANLAMICCEELTNSKSLIQIAAKYYDDAVENAKKRNAIEKPPVRPPVDPWIVARL